MEVIFKTTGHSQEMQKWYTVSECHKLTAYQESLLILCWKGSWKSSSKQQLISLVSCDTLAKLLTPILLDVKQTKKFLGTSNNFFQVYLLGYSTQRSEGPL